MGTDGVEPPEDQNGDVAPSEENYIGDVSLTLTLGTPKAIGSQHPTIKNYEVFFEDDGETGYFYALDFAISKDLPIQDAALVYQRLEPREVQLDIVWSKTLPRAILFCDRQSQAVFAFDLKKCWAHSGYPAGQWGDKSWSADAWEGFEDIKA
jgi:hypothetical protein